MVSYNLDVNATQGQAYAPITPAQMAYLARRIRSGERIELHFLSRQEASRAVELYGRMHHSQGERHIERCRQTVLSEIKRKVINETRPLPR